MSTIYYRKETLVRRRGTVDLVRENGSEFGDEYRYPRNRRSCQIGKRHWLKKGIYEWSSGGYFGHSMTTKPPKKKEKNLERPVSYYG